METGNIVLIIVGLVLFGYGGYLYPQTYRWIDCDQDIETNDWALLKYVFGIAPVPIVIGIHGIFEFPAWAFWGLLILLPFISVGILYLTKKA